MYNIEEYRDCVWSDHALLERFIHDLFVKIGTPPEDAAIIADVLITSDKRGIDSHGIGRLKPIYIDRINQGILSPVTQIDVVKETATTAVFDGNNGMGHVVAKHAMELAIAKARQYGTAMVVARSSSHYGIAGTILRQLRGSQRASGAERIYTAGEKEWIAWQYRKEHGIPVPPVLQRQLSGLNSRFGLGDNFPWQAS